MKDTLEQHSDDAVRASFEKRYESPENLKRNPTGEYFYYSVRNDFAIYMQGYQAGLAARNEWQPIETAPKDGTAILATLPDSDMCYVIRWGDEPENEEVKDEKGDGWRLCWDSFYFGTDDIFSPTHWMPLPQPPI